jgi:DNA-binding MarR family transcriptional regulator
MLPSKERSSMPYRPPTTIAIGLLLRQFEVRASRALNGTLGGLGLTVRHFGALLLMHRDGVTTQKDLVAQLITDKTAMVRIIDDLDRLGCLTRTPSTRDRRMSHLHLTTRGVELFHIAERRTQRVAEALFAVLSNNEKALLENMLDRLVTAELPDVSTLDGADL